MASDSTLEASDLMSDSKREWLTVLQGILLRCWLLGLLILFLWLGAILLMNDSLLAAHGTLFGLTTHELQIIHYCGIGLWKLIVIGCFFLPWLSVNLVLKKSL